MRSILCVLFLFASLCLFSAPIRVSAQCSSELNVGYFSQASTFWNAQKQGFVDLVGLDLCTSAVSGSTDAYNRLRNGHLHLLLSAVDNAFTRRFDPNQQQNVTMIGLLENSALQMLAVNWNITSIGELRGKNVIVDSPTSGLIFGLRRLLANYNLFYPRDFNMVSSGATATRFNGLLNGYYDDPVKGRIPIHAAILTSPYSNRVMTGEFVGKIRTLGLIKDQVLPIPGTSLHIDPKYMDDATRRAGIEKFVAAMLLARAYIRNPLNREDVIQQVMLAQSLTREQAEIEYAQKITEPLTGEVGTDFSFDLVGLSNVAFFKSTFAGYNADMASEYSNPRPYGLIDYRARDAALQIVEGIKSSIAVQTPADQCIYPANQGYSYSINHLAADLQASVSGGCKDLKVRFLSCTSDDLTAAPADCLYDAANDRLVISAKTNGVSSRVYTIEYEARDACAFGKTFTQTITVPNSAASACTDIRPACRVEVSTTNTNSWNANGVSYTQHTLHIVNPTSRAVSSLVLSLNAADQSNVEQVWNLDASSSVAGEYRLPAWSSTIAAGQSYNAAGYIAKNANVNFSVHSITCA